jgi:homopolymeric O-antigen transport system ATP-binding protein
MMTPIIEARGLGKRYRLGEPGARYQTVRESLVELFSAPLRLFGRRTRAEDFWALSEVAFDVARGEAVGVIGRNGAGKSTLLKILARITAPSTGSVRLRGRVASLLEVGTGFHPELTGRENIFLNGAIMGMRRAEIRARFDEIVAFSEVEQFLDTPVKRYSSGMYVRLAFAVAAHLEPEILIVDEVLGVGDASFQKKCLGKMQRLASGGRTVLFVSHNLAAVQRLCTRALLFSSGRVVADGPVAKVVSAYAGGAIGETPTEVDLARRGRVPGSDDARLLAARLSSEGLAGSVLDVRRPLRVELEYEVLRERLPLHPTVYVYNEEGHCVFATSDAHERGAEQPRAPGRYRAVLEVPGDFFAEGWLSLDVGLTTLDPAIVHCLERGLLSFHVSDPGDGARGAWPGLVRPRLPWTTEPLDVTPRRRSEAKSQ